MFPPKIVDLKASDVDKSSDRKTGLVVFKKKAYIDYHGVKSARPLFRFAWCYNSPYGVVDWQQKWPGTTFVTTEDDYWPETGTVDANGHYVYQDVVLMKIPIHVYLDKRRSEIQQSERAPDALAKSLHNEYVSSGVDISDEEIQTLLGMAK